MLAEYEAYWFYDETAWTDELPGTIYTTLSASASAYFNGGDVELAYNPAATNTDDVYRGGTGMA